MIEITVQSQRKIHAVDITDAVVERLPAGAEGIVHLFCPHTTAALVIGENEEKLMGDLERAAAHLLDHCGPFEHAAHGNPNAPAHILSSIAGCSGGVPGEAGRLRLGTYQRVLLLELDGPRTRRVWIFLPTQTSALS